MSQPGQQPYKATGGAIAKTSVSWAVAGLAIAGCVLAILGGAGALIIAGAVIGAVASTAGATSSTVQTATGESCAPLDMTIAGLAVVGGGLSIAGAIQGAATAAEAGVEAGVAIGEGAEGLAESAAPVAETVAPAAEAAVEAPTLAAVEGTGATGDAVATTGTVAFDEAAGLNGMPVLKDGNLVTIGPDQAKHILAHGATYDKISSGLRSQLEAAVGYQIRSISDGQFWLTFGGNGIVPMAQGGLKIAEIVVTENVKSQEEAQARQNGTSDVNSGASYTSWFRA